MNKTTYVVMGLNINMDARNIARLYSEVIKENHDNDKNGALISSQGQGCIWVTNYQKTWEPVDALEKFGMSGYDLYFSFLHTNGLTLPDVLDMFHDLALWFSEGESMLQATPKLLWPETEPMYADDKNLVFSGVTLGNAEQKRICNMVGGNLLKQLIVSYENGITPILEQASTDIVQQTLKKLQQTPTSSANAVINS